METRQVEALQETLDGLRAEVTELRASRERLLLAADADRGRIERQLHEGVQQHLVGLAVNLQLAGALMDADPAAATAILEEMQRDVQQALDDTAQLGEKLYPPLLEIGGLAAVLRSAALSAGIPASVEVAGGSSHPPQIARTVYFCWLEVLEHAEGEARVSATVREEEGALSFEFVERRDPSTQTVGRFETMLERLRDRVEALGGRLAVEADSARGTRVYGSLPLGP